METTIIAIAPIGSEQVKSYWEEAGIPFIGNPDYAHTIAKLYRQQVKLLKMGRMPAMVLIDKHGIMRMAHYSDSMSDYISVEDLLVQIRHLNDENGLC